MTASDPAEATDTAAPGDATAGDDSPAVAPETPAVAPDSPAVAPETAAPEEAEAVESDDETVIPPEPLAEDSPADGAESPESLRPAAVRWADEETHATALTWVDAETVAGSSPAPTFDQVSDVDPGVALMRGAKLRPAIARPGLLVPLGVLAGLLATYVGGALMWPLHEVAPTVESVEFATVPAPAAAVSWPAQGSAAVGIGGMATSASMADPVSIASITKVVSSLMVLDRMPLALGEQGPEFSFTYRDSLDYWSYRQSDQSALDVPVGGVLTEYQLLQGTLLGSANNYIDRLASEIWGSDRAFAEAATVWLRDRGLSGITVVTPSGFDERNVSTPEALVALGEYAMKNPVFAQIVGTKSVDLPGAGTVENTNGMLVDPGVVGIKTGTLVGWNLLTAKDITVGDTTVHLFAAVLTQDDDAQRLAATRSLFAETEAALQAQAPAVPQGTAVGEVRTVWGERIDVITDADADVILWNGAAAQATPDFALNSEWGAGEQIGTLTTAGPLNSTTTPLVLADDIEGPSPWWRLTHPIELLGLDTARN
ncbi:D-alanyl-D-alanine carboxypeptidase [Microbacterium sp. SSW1-49]|uniref:D-alanyl-D-alanine carboxypeptidase n=1 Tax=Microbacterium croceum TaxID=2851645 RepID=A0ABT0F9H5_9MICO|nr:D-alanyl-D-alanine carboxypeptidase [Microbacterium croceum]MCK2034668.1 D-alanyl-D-alanine carboxypeptidase [Microbacterium croceum]